MGKFVTFSWRTTVVILIIVDYFLFSTGNPSLTYSILGGWFIVPLVVAIIITASYGFRSYKRQENRQLFVLHLLGLVAVSALLFWFSGEARQFAAAKVEVDILAFVDDPTIREVDAAEQARALMAEIKKHRHSMERETFIPTFRRMDYLFKSDDGKKYRLILVKEWNGVPSISLLPTDS